MEPESAGDLMREREREREGEEKVRLKVGREEKADEGEREEDRRTGMKRR